MPPDEPSSDLDTAQRFRLISRQSFAALNTPQAWRLFYQIVGVLAAIVLFWLMVAAILSFLPAWMIVLATFVLGGIWLFKAGQQQQREARIDAGCCAQCGYDLRATPNICPECGRDASLDEPTWKKVRRNFAAKLAAEAKGPMPVLQVQEAQVSVETPRLKNVVIRRPPVDDEPIPLEPLPSEISLDQAEKTNT